MHRIQDQSTMDHSGKDLSPTMDYDREDLASMDDARKDLWLKEREAADLASPS